MAGFEPRRNNRGNYACPYCSHKAYKGKQAAINHIKRLHEVEAQIDQARIDADEKVRVANNEKWQAERRAERAEKQLADATKPETKPKWWSLDPVMLYCETEHIVFQNTRMPRGQTIEDTPCHSCGTRSLKLVIEIR